MKKLVIVCLLAVAAMGCKVRSIEKKDSNPVIGMDENEFKEINRQEQLIYLSNDTTSYSILRNAPENIEISDFYHFSKGKLFKFEQKKHYFNNRAIKIEDSKNTKN